MSRCYLCPRVNTCVQPQGPRNAEVFLVGEAPGSDENRLGVPFVGRTGDELNYHFLPLAGLHRDHVYVTNVIQCLPDRSGGKLQMSEAKDKLLAEVCAENHLFEEIERVKPKYIIPMGAFANWVLDPSVNLTLQHGIPRDSPYGKLFPSWHPAGGLHEPKKMLDIRTDWIRFKRLRAGTLPVRADKFPVTDYKEVTEVSEIRSLAKFSLMGCDTEFDPDENPVCLTYSVRPGSGRLIRSSRSDLLEEFQRVLNNWRGFIVFHHWHADKPILRKMGLTFPDKVIRDSMVRAFLLGNLPKGLKALAYRELGMTMTDFEDVVFPYSIPKVLDYYLRIQKEEWPKPEPEMKFDHKTGLWKKYQAQGLATKIKRFFTDIKKNADKDIIGSWNNWVDSHEMIEARLGKFYGLDIRDIPFENLIAYACRDADATIRIWPVLESMVDNMAGRPQESWRV